VRVIATRLGRSPSTISRERRRNTRAWDPGYEPVVALWGSRTSGGAFVMVNQAAADGVSLNPVKLRGRR